MKLFKARLLLQLLVGDAKLCQMGINCGANLFWGYDVHDLFWGHLCLL